MKKKIYGIILIILGLFLGASSIFFIKKGCETVRFANDTTNDGLILK